MNEENVRERQINAGKIVICISAIFLIISLIVLFIGINKKISSVNTTCPSMGESGWFECESQKGDKLMAYSQQESAKLMIIIMGGFSLGISLIFLTIGIITYVDGKKLLKSMLENKNNENYSYESKKQYKSNICRYCGSKNKIGEIICSTCGAKLDNDY